MRLGIIGSGQLGLMMILEAKKLGIEFNVIDSTLDGPASRIADRAYTYDDFKDFVDTSDFVTYEFEHVDGRVLEYAKSEGKLRPGMLPVELKRDRSGEKNFLKEKGLPVGPFRVAETAAAALEYASQFGNAVIKSAYGGYDGKGQYYVKNGKLPENLPEDKYVVEEFVEFDYEASIIGARNSRGEVRFFDPSFNVNRHGMLYSNIAPTEDSGMREITTRLMEQLSYVGVIGVEFFIVKGKALINEFAPRVHNTGHHTLLGSSISQFEQHVRAVCDFPMDDPKLYRPSGILNVVGTEPDDDTVKKILEIPETQFFWYGKKGIRKRRKVGHVNVAGENYDDVYSKISRVSQLLYRNEPDDFFTD